jgi:hypothetical protein
MEAYIYDSVRTPGGKGNGSLARQSVQLLTTLTPKRKQFRHHFGRRFGWAA